MQTIVKLSLLHLYLKDKIMADNKNIQDGRDRAQVSGSEDYEVQYLADKLGVSTEKVKDAIAAVGNSREKLEEYLRR